MTEDNRAASASLAPRPARLLAESRGRGRSGPAWDADSRDPQAAGHQGPGNPAGGAESAHRRGASRGDAVLGDVWRGGARLGWLEEDDPLPGAPVARKKPWLAAFCFRRP